MFTSLGHFRFILWSSFIFLIFRTQDSVTATVIYGNVGWPVHLPCYAFETLGITNTSHIESMWGKQQPNRLQLVIVKDQNGIKEKFRQRDLGESTIQRNASSNAQFYGRVNVSASLGLVIENVQLDDAGIFLCRYKNTITTASDNSEVKLIVFDDLAGRTACNNTDTPIVNDTTGTGTPKNENEDENDSDNPNKDTNCLLWKMLFAVAFGLLILGPLGGLAHKYITAFKRDRDVPQDSETGPHGNERDGGENCVPNDYVAAGNAMGLVSQIGGKANGYICGEDTENGIAGGYRADNGNVPKDRFLTERGKKCKYLTSEL